MKELKVNMPREMLKDALCFKEIAMNKVESREERWRYLRASFLYACMAVEGFLNNYLLNYVEDHKERLEKEIEDYLTSEISIHTKLTVGLKITSGHSMNPRQEPYKTFKNINSLRNKLVHYSWEEGEEAYREVTVENADRAIENARVMIKEIHRLDQSPCPDWIGLI